MLDYKQHPERGYVELKLDGSVSKKDLEAVVSKLGPLMDQCGKVGILKHIVSFGGITPAALWDDLKFAFRHLKHVGPVAVVSDKKWIEIWTKLAAPILRSDVRFFEEEDIAEARTWLTGEMTSIGEEATRG